MKETKKPLALLQVPQDQQGQQTPQDLLSLKEMCLKHCLDYDYLYKWSVQNEAIKVYFRGVWKVSESEVLTFINNEAEKKLNKIRAGKGGI